VGHRDLVEQQVGNAVAVVAGTNSPSRRSRLRLTPAMQWALLLLAFAVAWWVWPASSPARYEPAAPRVEYDGFLAVSYVGVGDEPDSSRVTPERLREHLDAILEAGYCPITLEDARAFLLDRTPLPGRPLLLVFEDGRRRTVREAEALLQASNLPATLVVHADATEQKSFSYPLWRHLRSLARTGRWSFAARLEPDPAPPERTTRGGARAAALVADRLGGDATLALIAPASMREAGAVPAADRRPRGVDERFALAFAPDGYAFNHRDRPATGLSMLRADPTWTGKELVSRLAAHEHRRGAVHRFSAGDWVFTYGDIACAGNTVRLDPLGRRAAEAWLAGTESWRCLSGHVALETRPETQSWIVLRSAPGGDFLRLGWTGSRVEVQTCVGGGEPLRLASEGVAPGLDRAEIDFRLLDARIRITVQGGEDASPRTYPVPRSLEHGMVGLSTWALHGKPRPVPFERFRLEPALARAAIRSSIEELQRGGEEPPDVVVPAWFEPAEAKGSLGLAGEGDPAFIVAAAHQGSSIWPLVLLPSPLTADAAVALRAALDRVRERTPVDGFLLDLRGTAAAEPKQAPGFWEELLGTASPPLGVVLDPERETLPGDVLERLSWIAVPATDPQARVPAPAAIAPGHKMLILRAETDAPW
jgi:hypothetical protein